MEGTTGRQMDGLADFVFGLAPEAIPDAARDAAQERYSLVCAAGEGSSNLPTYNSRCQRALT